MQCLEGMLPELIRRKEESVSTGIGTARTIAEYVEDSGFFSVEHFLAYLGEGTRVLDCGSGADGFALDVELKQLPITVISLNPRRNRMQAGKKIPSLRFLKSRLRLIEKMREEKFPDLPIHRRAISKLFTVVDQHAIDGFGHNIPLEDESVDFVIDNQGASTYSYDRKTESAEVYTLYILEALRVLKTNGKLLLQDTTIHDRGVYMDKVSIFKTLADMGYLSYKEVYKPVLDELGSYGSFRGVEITKIKHPVFYDHKD